METMSDEERCRELTDSLPGIIYEADRSGRLVFINQAAVAMSGYSREDLAAGLNVAVMVVPEDRERATANFQSVLAGNEIGGQEYTFLRKDGSTFPVIIRSRPAVHAGKIIGLRGFVIDITEHKHTEEALRKSNELFETLTRISPVGIFRADPAGRYTFVNERWSRIAGLAAEEAAGDGWLRSIHPGDRERIREKWRDSVKAGAPFKAEYRFLSRPDGAVAWVICEAVPEQGARGEVRGYVGTVTDITDRKQMEESLLDNERRYQQLSITDSLTGLYNLRHFYERLRTEVSRADRYKQPLSLLLLDIDDFKRYNDTYGHLEGDRVLEKLAEVALQCLRRSDSAYRYGGEEFVAILPHTSGRAGKVSAERIRQEFKKVVFAAGGENHGVTVSIGIAEHARGEEITEFIRRADRNMYRAKEQGKDSVFYA
jgi:diguanylate cyclase (GGDEF)-like protein/PAS domain S-box-containing protein